MTMIKRRLLGGVAALLLVCATDVGHRPASAQVSGVALAAFGNGSLFDGFVGPWRLTATGVDINLITLCYAPATRQRAIANAIAAIPDGSSLLDLRQLATTAVVGACESSGITVPRTNVLLPALQFGL